MFTENDRSYNDVVEICLLLLIVKIQVTFNTYSNSFLKDKTFSVTGAWHLIMKYKQGLGSSGLNSEPPVSSLEFAETYS